MMYFPTYNSFSYHITSYLFFSVPSNINEMTEIPLKDGEIVITTYPKYGMTLMQKNVLSLLTNRNKDAVTDPMGQSRWFKKLVSQVTIKSLTSWVSDTTTQGGGGGVTLDFLNNNPCFILKTRNSSHLSPCKGLGETENLNFIIMTHNPADMDIFMHHQSPDIPGFGDFDHFLNELFLPGRVGSGCFW